MYKLHEHFVVIDFPGSTSLDKHSKTFENCGAMNNFVVLVVPFLGGIDTTVTWQIAKVFSVMAGSSSTEIILCLNKCVSCVREIVDENSCEKTPDTDPVLELRKEYAEKINKHIAEQAANERRRESGEEPMINLEAFQRQFEIKTDNVLLTDWKVGDSEEMRSLGVVGVSEVRRLITNT
jgi:hypothetical protein